MTGWNAQGNNATITGYLKHVAWEGRISTSATNYFGAVTITTPAMSLPPGSPCKVQ